MDAPGRMERTCTGGVVRSMRTTLLAAALITALVLPVVLYREPPVPLDTAAEVGAVDFDPVLEMAANGCEPTMQPVEGGATLIRLCPQAH